MATLESGDSSGVKQYVDLANHAGRNAPYDPDGYVLTPVSFGDIGASRSVYPFVGGGRDFRTVVANRARLDGSQPVSNDAPLFWDPLEGAALNTNLWTSTVTTWTVASVTNGVLLMNPGSSTTTTTGQLLSSIPRIPRYPGVPIVFRCRAKPGAHSTGSVHELGFGLPGSATGAMAGDGPFWRKTSAGQWQAVVIFNGTEVTDNDPIDDATFTASVATTNYAEFVIVLYDDRAEFFIETSAGAQVAYRKILWSQATNNPGFASEHLYVCLRSYNASAPSTAVSLAVADVKVDQLDMPSGKSWVELSVMNGYGAESSPTAFTQTANYSNNAAPTTRTVTNTTALEATLGGHVSWNNAGTAFAADDTKDWILFGFQAPAPFGLLIKNIRIDTVNLGATNGASYYTVEYAISTNLSAVSLATAAPNGPRFRALGFMSIVNGAVAGQQFQNPITVPCNIYIEPGKYFHLVGRVISGAATASQVIRTTCFIDGVWV